MIDGKSSLDNQGLIIYLEIKIYGKANENDSNIVKDVQLIIREIRMCAMLWFLKLLMMEKF